MTDKIANVYSENCLVTVIPHTYSYMSEKKRYFSLRFDVFSEEDLKEFTDIQELHRNYEVKIAISPNKIRMNNQAYNEEKEMEYKPEEG